MDSNRLAFNQLRFKGLDRQSVQGRRAVEQYRMTFGNLIQNIPNFRGLPLDHFFRAAHSMDITKVFQPANDKRFEQNQRHLLGQTALMKFELRADHNDGTARVIDALAEQVLTETSPLALEHVA